VQEHDDDVESSEDSDSLMENTPFSDLKPLMGQQHFNARANCCAICILLIFALTVIAVKLGANGSAPSAAMSLRLHLLKEYPLAVCNDGTASGYYYRKSSTGSNVWIVFQEGGGWCWDAYSCSQRSGDHISSSHWNSTVSFPLGSIFSTAIGTGLHGANVVFIKYCSSDGYVGDTPASPATGNMHFRGRQVVEATFADLHTSQGMGGIASTVLYVGCSAGGRGVMHNHNRIRSLAMQRYGVGEFVGLVDSGLYLDLELYSYWGTAYHTALREQAKGVISHIGADIDPACAEAYPGETWKCLLGEYVVGVKGLLQGRHVVHAFQYDSYQLYVDMMAWQCVDPDIIKKDDARRDYAAAFADKTRRVLERLEGNSDVAVHSSACYEHCNYEATFSTSQIVNGVTLSDVVDSFVFHKPGPTYVIANCTGFACGQQCTNCKINYWQEDKDKRRLRAY